MHVKPQLAPRPTCAARVRPPTMQRLRTVHMSAPPPLLSLPARVACAVCTPHHHYECASLFSLASSSVLPPHPHTHSPL